MHFLHLTKVEVILDLQQKIMWKSGKYICVHNYGIATIVSQFCYSYVSAIIVVIKLYFLF